MCKVRLSFLVFCILFLHFFANSQNQFKYDLSDLSEYFSGNWEADQKSCVGFGSGNRSYETIMNGTFLHIKNHAEFPQADKDKAPETHDDWGFFSFDQSRNKIILREFHSEGFINQYVLSKISDDRHLLIFTSEAFENVPKAWQARLTFTILDDTSFEELFELAKPGQEFTTYVKGKWLRTE